MVPRDCDGAAPSQSRAPNSPPTADRPKACTCTRFRGVRVLSAELFLQALKLAEFGSLWGIVFALTHHISPVSVYPLHFNLSGNRSSDRCAQFFPYLRCCNVFGP